MLLPDNLPPARHRARPVPSTAATAQASPQQEAAEAERSYEVGYGKPPIRTRFQKGQSGNPKGRKKGSRNLDTLVLELLDERIPINTPAGRRSVSRIEMLLRKLIELGGKGNARAIDQVLRHYALAQATSAPQISAGGEPEQDITDSDVASLALLRDLFLAESAAEAGGAS